ANEAPRLGDDQELHKVTTRHLDADSQKRHEVKVVNGKLVDHEGNNVDTTGATGWGSFGSAGWERMGRHIYAMDEKGTMRTSDTWKDARLVEIPQPKVEGQKQGMEVAYTNHSTLLNGKKAAGAGEMRVEDGQVKVVSDASGHYKPDSKMMQQTIGSLEE